MKLPSLPTRSLLVVVFAVTLTSVAIAAATEYWGMTHLNGFLGDPHRGDLALLEAVRSMHDDILQLRRYEKDVFINITSPDSDRAYRAKWDRAFTSVRYDLVRARLAAPASEQHQLQEVADSIAGYRSSFERTYGLIVQGDIATAQQANAGMSKDSVRGAENRLAAIEHGARQRMSQFEPVIDAQRFGFALNVLVLLGIAGLFFTCTRSSARLVST